MKTKLIICLFVTLATASVHAHGPSTGGGGFTASCPATSISPASTELLDLYEGREVLGFTLAQSTGDLREDYFLSAKRTYTIQGAPSLADQNREWLMQNVTRIMQSVKFVEQAAELPVANDLGQAPWIPSQCSIDQVAYFDDRAGVIYVLRPLWEKLDSMNQAGLLQHEIFGREFRKLGDMTSEMARRTVAHAFAVSGNLPIFDGLPSTAVAYIAHPAINGNGGTSDISSFQTAKYFSIEGEVRRLQFDTLGGRALLTKTWADLPYQAWNLKLDGLQCVVADAGVYADVTVPVQGAITKGLSVNLKMATGAPVQITVLRDSEVLSTGYVGLTSCASSN